MALVRVHARSEGTGSPERPDSTDTRVYAQAGPDGYELRVLASDALVCEPLVTAGDLLEYAEGTELVLDNPEDVARWMELPDDYGLLEA